MENTTEKKRETVNVIFATDKKYLPYTSVAIISLSEKSTSDFEYDVYVLSSELDESDLERLHPLVKSNVHVHLKDINGKRREIRESLVGKLRDYYSESIYYRIFAPSLLPQLSRAVYLDSDVVLTNDVAKLYFTDLGEMTVGAVTDESVISEPVFARYVTRYLGFNTPDEYFNSGVLLMDFERMRNDRIEEKFISLLSEDFRTVAPDQDVLNFILAGKVKYLLPGWNKHPIPDRELPKSRLYLMHFNMFMKPWRYDGTQNEELFWFYAMKTHYLSNLLEEKQRFSIEDARRDAASAENLLLTAKDITENDTPLYERDNFLRMLK